MDWIRLGHSGKDLTSVGGKKMAVSREELQKHNKEDDAWMAFRGIFSLIQKLSNASFTDESLFYTIENCYIFQTKIC